MSQGHPAGGHLAHRKGGGRKGQSSDLLYKFISLEGRAGVRGVERPNSHFTDGPSASIIVVTKNSIFCKNI